MNLYVILDHKGARCRARPSLEENMEILENLKIRSHLINLAWSKLLSKHTYIKSNQIMMN
jgi:uncharacterized protein (DUF4213/DUF364 family)